MRLCLMFVWQIIIMAALGVRFSVHSAGSGTLLNTFRPQSVRKCEHHSARVKPFQGQGLTQRKNTGYSEMKVSH